MHRWRVVAAIVVLVALTSCKPQDKPAEKTDEIGGVGDCYGQSSSKAVDCGLAHVAESIFVGDEPPPSGSLALAPCRDAQSAYLGQDFNTRLDVQLWVAGDLSWYRCDVFVRQSTQGGTGYETLTGSLKGVLDEGASVDLQSCLSEPYDPAGDQVYVPCSEPHVAQELVVAPAIGTLDEPFPDDIADRAARACNAAASASGLLSKQRTVKAYYPKNEDAWASGERTADCWVIAGDGDVLPPVDSTS